MAIARGESACRSRGIRHFPVGMAALERGREPRIDLQDEFFAARGEFGGEGRLEQLVAKPLVRP